MTDMPFEFSWCYETEEGEDICGVLPIADPEDVTSLHLKITNILAGDITIQAIDREESESSDNYHFELEFNAGILAEPEKIAVKDSEWLITSENDSLYLLWNGNGNLVLAPNQSTEVILTRVAAPEGQTSGETKLTINWEDYEDHGIEFPNTTKIPHSPYYEETTLELEMIKATGKSNIPLFVGFVGSNKVLNTDETLSSSLQLRITNTDFEKIITFKANESSLSVVLEVEANNVDSLSVPWALGTEDQVNEITISITGWEQDGEKEELKVGDTVKALKWTFNPQKEVNLQPQETLLINFANIKTLHPTGETNLYLGYEDIEGYQNGQFVCQIEKAPLVVDDKVRMGTNHDEVNGTEDSLLFVKNGHISLDSNAEIQNLGPLTFRSNIDGDGDSVLFYNQDQRLMRLDSQGHLNFKDVNGQKLNLWGSVHGIGVQGGTTYFRTSRNFAWYSEGIHDGGELNPGDGGTVRMVIKDDKVGIGKANPQAKLDVEGDAAFNGRIAIFKHNPECALDVNGSAQVQKIGIGTEVPDDTTLKVSGNASIDGDLEIGTKNSPAKLTIKGAIVKGDTGKEEILKLQRPGEQGTRDANTVSFRVGSYDYDNSLTSRTQLDIVLSNHSSENNDWGNNAEEVVLSLRGDGKVYIKDLYTMDRDHNYWWYIRMNEDAGNYDRPHGYKQSDINLKKDIQTLSQTLSKLTSLRGVSFKWNEQAIDREIKQMEENIVVDSEDPQERERILEEKRQEIREANSHEVKGFIAQEIEKIFPEWVDTDKYGYKMINMAEFLPVIVEAIKELQAEIEALKQAPSQPSRVVSKPLSTPV